MQNYINRILLNSDAESGPLDLPAGDMDLRLPRIKPETIMTFKIAECQKKQTQAGGERVAIVLKAEEAAVDTDGRPTAPGFPVRHSINGPSGARTWGPVNREIGQFLVAVDKTISAAAFWSNPSILEGKLVKAKVGISPAQNGFAESNNIRQFIALS